VSQPPTPHGLLQDAFESLPDAVVVVDADECIVLANGRARQLCGRAPEELVGRPVSVLVPSLAEAVRAPVQHDGRTYTVMTVRDGLDRDGGQERADRVREDLIATISHELRTPLTSIIGYTELLQDLPDEDVSPTARRLLDVVERSAARELRLVDDLLTLAFLGEERMSVALGPVDLGEIVRGAAETGRTPARRRGLTLEVHDAGVGLVHGDAQRLGQVVDNLLTNAVKFTPPGGRVDLRVLDDGDAALLEVADTGPGVPAQDLERIFERLYRSASAVRGQVPGAGLGLPIVRAIMEAHGGLVEATSEPGAGTVVRVRVPYASSGRTSTTAEVASGP
jgi:two-component system, OmpR family, phosphate regulon sensor histidine kinase PhoR